MNLPLLKNANVEGKTVMLRLDLDVPLTPSGKIIDDTRLHVGLDSLKYLLSRGAYVTVVGHMGRPKDKWKVGEELLQLTKDQEQFSLAPVVKWFETHLHNHLHHPAQSTKIGHFLAWHLANNFSILENIRFYEGEEENDENLSRMLAELCEIFVNDAFADSHRAHSSIVGVAKLLPHFAGLRLELEVDELERVLKNPKRPLCVIVGGAKIETKLPLLERMHQYADYVLVGGKLAHEGKQLLQVQHEKVVGRKSALIVGDPNENKTDITDNSVENFMQIIDMCQTVIWNGPLGALENSEHKSQEAKAREADSGTQKIAERIIKDKCYSIVGGGDTLGYLREQNMLDHFSFFSTGGGAMLSFLAGEKLPGLEVLLK